MRKLIILLLYIFTLSSAITYAQPKITLNITGGYGLPTGDFKVDVPHDPNVRLDADDLPYYTKQMWNFGADGKLAVSKDGKIRVTLGLANNMFSNSTNGTFRIDTNGTLGQVTFNPNVNIFSVYLGGEYAFSPEKKVNPFVGLAIAGNFFGGNFTFDQPVFTKGAIRSELEMKSETRIGFVLDGGVDVMLNKSVGLIAGIKYNFINPIGKGADDEEEIAPDEVDLGDAEHVREDGMSSPSKSIQSFNGYLGVSFYFGAPKSTRK